MNRHLLALTLLCSIIPAFAADNSAVIHHTDGTTTTLTLSDKLMVTFPDEASIRFSDGDTDIVFPQKEVNYVSYPTAHSNVKDVAANNMNLSMHGKTLHISGVETESSIQIYDASGCKIRELTTDGSVELNLESLPAGIYTIRAGRSSMKIAL